MLTWRWIEQIEDFNKIAGEWDDLLFSVTKENFFLLSDFILTWWKYYHCGRKLAILLFYEDQKLVGGIPLCIKREWIKGAGLRCMVHVGGVAANYTEPLFSRESLFFFPWLEKALKERSDWDIFLLRELRHNHFCVSEVIPSRSQAKRRRGIPDLPLFSPYRLRQHQMNWTIDISSGLKSYFDSLDRRFKRDLRVRRKRLFDRLGDLRLIEISGKENIEKYFDVHVGFSKESFRDRKGKSNFSNPAYSAFFKEFLILMDQKKRLSCHVLSTERENLAIAFGYRFQNELNLVLISFNPSRKEFRPGYLLIEEIVKKADAIGQRFVNIFGGEAFYKQQLCNRIEPLYQMRIYRDFKSRYMDGILLSGDKLLKKVHLR